MKAYQIVIKGDERSEEYAEMSRKSFEIALDEGYIDSIETCDDITPQSDDFQEHADRFVWEASLMLGDKASVTGLDEHASTEAAGMCDQCERMGENVESQAGYGLE